MDFKDDDGRRYGDWQKKSLRKDANDIVGEDSGEKAWYYQNFWIVVLLLVFWPVGVYLCWKSDWPIVAKIVASVLVAAMVVGFMLIRYSMGL